MEIEQKYTRIARTKVLQKIAMNNATYVACGSPYICHLCKIRGRVRPLLSQRARWLPKRWKESSSQCFDGKERKDKCVYRSLVHKIEERKYTHINRKSRLVSPVWGSLRLAPNIHVAYEWVSLFSGMERWNGMVEWNGGMKWNGIVE